MRRTLRSWLCRLGNLFDRERRERELAEEIESHIELHVEDHLRCGMSPEKARRAALLKLGGVEATKEIYRDQLGIPVVEHFIRDARYAAVAAVKNKAFTAVVVLTLGLGLGVTILVFSVVDALFLRPLPYADADRLAVIQKPVHSGADKGLLSFSELQDLKARGIFEDVAGCAYSAWPGVLTSGDQVELTSVVGVTDDFFKVLGVRPLVGSTRGQRIRAVLSSATLSGNACLEATQKRSAARCA